MTELRVAVVGAGHLGRIHGRLLGSAECASLSAIVDPCDSARETLAAEFLAPAFASHHELIGRVDAAIIAAPTPHHAAIAVDLLEAGLDLLIEKPLAASPAEAERILAAAEGNARKIQVGHVERFNPAFTRAREALPRFRYLEADRSSPYSFRSTDVGVVYDLMIHDLDLAMQWADSPVVDVDAIGGVVIGPDEDWAQARLRFANGALANLSACRTEVEPRRVMVARGDGRRARIDFATSSASILEPGEAVRTGKLDAASLRSQERSEWKERLFEDVLELRVLPELRTNAIEQEQRDFFSAILCDTQPRVTATQARDAIAVAERIRLQIVGDSGSLRRAG